jgi:zinc protease
MNRLFALLPILAMLTLTTASCGGADSGVPANGTFRVAQSARPFQPTTAPSNDEEWLRTVPPPLPARPFTSHPMVEKKLSNGIRVLLMERHDFPSVGIALVLDRGTCDSGAASGIYGLALGGSPGILSRENEEYLHQIAAPFQVFVGDDYMAISTAVLPPLAYSALSRLIPIFLAPDFAGTDIDRARRRRRDILASVGVRQEQLAERALRQSLFGAASYGTVLVDPSEIDAESDAHVRDIAKVAASSRHVTVVAVGDITADALINALERSRRDLPHGDDNVSASACAALPSPSIVPQIQIVDDPGAEQSRVRIGAVGVPVGAADGPALDVLSNALGASASSRLNLKLRGEHGFTYGVRMRSYNWRAQGLIELTTNIDTARTGTALKGLVEEIDRAASAPLDDAELRRAKVKSLADDGAHPDALHSILDIAAYGLPTNAFAIRSQALIKVTSADVTKVAAQYFGSSRRSMTIVGDANRIMPLLRESGFDRSVIVEHVQKK